MVRAILKTIVMIGIVCSYIGCFIIASVILVFKYPDEEEEDETDI